MRGKFLKVKSKEDQSQDYVLSKFYYTFEIEEDDSSVIIGVHQEDKRNLGSHLRPYLDASFIILKRDEEDEDILEYYSHTGLRKDREFFETLEFEQGSYVLVPFTSGTLLQKIESEEQKKEEAKGGKISLKKMHSSQSEVMEYYASTVNDIFRKIDLTANGVLSAKELNQFGVIINNEKFKKIKQSDFKSASFKNISCTSEGLTRHGFFQYLFKNLKEKELEDALKRLGYDEMLNSLKSRVFVITFHSIEPMNITIEDILQGNMHKTATNILINHLISEDENIEVDEDKHEEVKIIKYTDK